VLRSYGQQLSVQAVGAAQLREVRSRRGVSASQLVVAVPTLVVRRDDAAAVPDLVQHFRVPLEARAAEDAAGLLDALEPTESALGCLLTIGGPARTTGRARGAGSSREARPKSRPRPGSSGWRVRAAWFRSI
jgi:hypothetical protein